MCKYLRGIRETANIVFIFLGDLINSVELEREEQTRVANGSSIVFPGIHKQSPSLHNIALVAFNPIATLSPNVAPIQIESNLLIDPHQSLIEILSWENRRLTKTAGPVTIHHTEYCWLLHGLFLSSVGSNNICYGGNRQGACLVNYYDI
jgi:hypothetical protein